MYGHQIEISGPFAQAMLKVQDALKNEGFGVLSDIDIQQAMKEKLGETMPAYRILGACNPPLAHRALQAEPEIGLLLPCNVTVRELPDSKIGVGFLDPQTMVQLTDNAEIARVADDAGQRLERVRRRLADAG